MQKESVKRENVQVVVQGSLACVEEAVQMNKDTTLGKVRKAKTSGFATRCFDPTHERT